MILNKMTILIWPSRSKYQAHFLIKVLLIKKKRVFW